MKISDFIHEQSCRIVAIEEKLREEEESLAEMTTLEVVLNDYKKQNPSAKLYIWLVNRNYDLSHKQMDLLEKIKL